MADEIGSEVQNPGSALGEAIGVLMERALNRFIAPLVESKGLVFITSGPGNRKTGKVTKLILKDINGVEYNIDSVIANSKLQPLILIESKYIRYIKHNRDKGSWVCTAHTALRRKFSSVRSSIAIIAGSWSGTSKTMMRSSDIILFEIPFTNICEILRNYNIEFMWGEKDRQAAYLAWDIYSKLSNRDHEDIGNKMIDIISDELRSSIEKILDDSIPREINEVEIQITTNLGEVKIFIFDNVEKAVEFLENIDNEEILSTENSIAIFDND